MKKRLIIFAGASVIVLASFFGWRAWENSAAQNNSKSALPTLITDEAEIKWRYERAKEESARAGGNSMSELMQQQAAEQAQIQNWHNRRKDSD